MSGQLPPPPREKTSEAQWQQWYELLWREVRAGGSIGDFKLHFSDTLPTHGTWVWTDGTSYLRSEYPDWFAVHGTRFGAADATHFNVPDSRGRFMRFWDNGAGNDPNAGTRTAMNSGGETGDEIGTLQAQGTKRPTTPFTADSQGAHTHSYTAPDGGASANFGANYVVGAPSSQTTSSNGAHTHTITGGGDSETRPINFYGALITRLK